MRDDLLKALRRLRNEPGVRAGCLLGSLARGDADGLSDIDAMLVVDDGLANPRRVRLLARHEFRPWRAQLSLITASRLRDAAETPDTYVLHIGLESVSAFDRRGDLRRCRRRVRQIGRALASGEHLRQRLSLYEDLTWCHGSYLRALADIYAYGRAGAMLGLAQRGIFEFSRAGPLLRLPEVLPETSIASTALRELEPFYIAARRSARVTLPFDPDGERDRVDLARRACAEVLRHT